MVGEAPEKTHRRRATQGAREGTDETIGDESVQTRDAGLHAAATRCRVIKLALELDRCLARSGEPDG